MKLNRRLVLAGIAGLPFVAAPLRAFASSTLKIGMSEVHSVSDGNLVLPGSFYFDGLPQDEVAQILASRNLSPDQLKPPCNVTLLRDADRVILFDAGAGPAFVPTAGTLLDSLAAIDVAPDDITDVVFTHGHPDHLWGVLDDFEEPVFANARYHMAQTEWDYWRDPATVESIGPDRVAFAVGAARRLEAIEERASFFADGQEILSGIMAHASPGHTPGHMCFEVRSGTDAVLIGGDAIGNHHIAFARPDWASGADQDPALAAQTRVRLMDKLAQDQIALIGFHLPDGGIGRVEREGAAYRFSGIDQ
jgi:glyoxylase-like metal-dependent hydrolase (beta-lactamase superfamily II)